jgi:uncharacterized coiled-coil protein SlyX
MPDRTEDIEVKLSFLEHLVAELDDLVRRQHARIDDLERDLRELRGEVGAAAVRGGPEEERPPHHDRW